MTPERWQRIKRLFDGALGLVDGEKRARYLRQNAGQSDSLIPEVNQLLASDARAGSSLATGALGLAAPPAPGWIGRRIGPYRIAAELGRGGMGTVFRAMREDIPKSVAIKLVTGWDEGLLRRFESERAILARLEHPGIATLFDGGVTEEGQPYLVMEQVEGERIDTFARRIPIRARLRLYLEVCSAVHYAHQNLVIHRDLKPNNILVTADGRPKLLDFGIAKIIRADVEGEATVTVWRAMTPEYASPEQVRGEPITTASDVYSLGVLLFEMLTGQRFYRAALQTPEDVVEAVCKEDARKPSSVAARPCARLLKGDLDTIVLKAVRKEPKRRYTSVQELGEDVRRHLQGLPVEARGDALAYRASRFARRHRGIVVAASLLLISLLLGLGTTIRQARIAESNRARAERRFKDLRKLTGTFVFEVNDAIRDLPGSTSARDLVVRTALEYLDGLAREADGDLSLKRELADAYERIGDIRGMSGMPNLGTRLPALESYQKAVAAHEKAFGGAIPNLSLANERARLHHKIARLQSELGRSGESGQSSGRAIQILSEALEREPTPTPSSAREQTADAHRALASYHNGVGDQQASLDSAARALSLYDALLRERPRDMGLVQTAGQVHNEAGTARRYRGDISGAIAASARAVTLLEQVHLSSPDSVRYRQGLAGALRELGKAREAGGDLDGARITYQRAIALSEGLARADSANSQPRHFVALVHQDMGKNRLAAGDHAQSLTWYRSARDAFERLLAERGDNQPSRSYLASSWSGIGKACLVLADRSRTRTRRVAFLQEAAGAFARSIELFEGMSDMSSRHSPMVDELKRHLERSRQELRRAVRAS